MTDRFVGSIRSALLKGLEAFGKGATNFAEGAQQKLNELNLDSRRRTLKEEIPSKALELFRAGVALPEELISLLTELAELENQLGRIRAAKENESNVAEESTADDIESNEAFGCETDIAKTEAEADENLPDETLKHDVDDE